MRAFSFLCYPNRMIILPHDAAHARKKQRTIRPARPPRSVRKNYERALRDEVKLLKAQTANLSQVIGQGVNRMEAASMLAAMSQQANARFAAIADQAASTFVQAVNNRNREALQNSIARAFSVDFATIVDDPDTQGLLDLALIENVNLIKSIPEKHFSLVGQAVLDNYRGKPMPNGQSLAERLRSLGPITDRRAKFIARDQTAKITGDLNQIRQESNGIDSYIWRNSRDNRVVGNPGGKYPKGTPGHMNHWDREGKVFEWSEPPPDGHAGHAPGCRCYGEPVLNLDKLKAQYV